MTALRRYPVLAALVIGALFMVLPFAVVAVNAVKSPAEYSAHGPLSLPAASTSTGSRTSGSASTSGKSSSTRS